MGVFRQFKAVVKKNFLIQRRQFWKVTFWRLILPFIIGLVISLFTIPQAYGGYTEEKDMERKPDPMKNLLQLVGIFLLIIPLSITIYSSPCSFIIGQTVAEKENKMRETLRIMSLSRVSYMLANFTSEACHACLSSVVLFYGYMIPMWMNSTYEGSLIY